MEVDPLFEISTDPIAMLEARSELRAMEGAWDKLQERDRLVVKMRLEGHTLKETGEAIGGISRERTRQIQWRALKRMVWEGQLGRKGSLSITPL